MALYITLRTSSSVQSSARLIGTSNKIYAELRQISSHSCKYLLFLPLHRLVAKDFRYKTAWLRQAIVTVGHQKKKFNCSMFYMRQCLHSWLCRSTLRGAVSVSGV